MNKIILQGGGDHARVVLDCLLFAGMNVVALYDPKYSGDLFGIPQCGTYDPTAHAGALSVIAIGDNRLRKKVAGESKHGFVNAIHPSSVISRFSSLGSGNMILHRSIVQAQCTIGDHVILNTGSQADHDCRIASYAHIGPGAVLCGTVSVGEGAFIGAGSVVIPGRSIGEWAIVGAGSVVTADIPAHAVAVGNPARIIRYNRP